MRIVLDGRGRKKTVRACAISGEDFRKLEELINDSHFFKCDQPVVVTDAATLRIKALRGDEQHTVTCGLDFHGVPPQFRKIVTLIDRLVAPLMSDDDKAANRPVSPLSPLPAKGDGTARPE